MRLLWKGDRTRRSAYLLGAATQPAAGAIAVTGAIAHIITRGVAIAVARAVAISAGTQYIGGPWLDVVWIGHILHREHFVPDLRHYVECQREGIPVWKFHVNKDAFIAMP